MKGIYSLSGASVLVSLEEAKTIYSCLSIASAKLDEEEFLALVGVPRAEAAKMMNSLRGIISDAGAWGIP